MKKKGTGNRLQVTGRHNVAPLKNSKYIAVFCSAENLPEKYTRPAKEFAKLMVRNGYGLVWGGSDAGLMSIVAREVKEQGGRIIGVSVKYLKEIALEHAHEMIIAKNLGERKAIILAHCHAVVALVGGTGTLDEISEAIELKKHGVHHKPILLINTDHFYQGFKTQLQTMHAHGLLQEPVEELIHFVDTPREAMEFLNRALLYPL